MHFKPDFKLPFCDASDTGLGCVSEREYLSVKVALEKYQLYIEGNRFQGVHRSRLVEMSI